MREVTYKDQKPQLLTVCGIFMETTDESKSRKDILP